MLRRAAPAAALGIAVYALVAFLPPVDALDRAVPADLALYESFGEQMTAGRLPYRDFYVEYPPGAVPAFFVPALAGAYPTAFRLETWALGAAAIVLVAALLARVGAGQLRLVGGVLVVALAPLPLRQVFFDRYDLWPATLLVAALAALVLGRHRLGGAALGVAAAAKVFPLVVLPAAVLHRTRRLRRETALAFVAAAVVVALPFAALGHGGLGFTTLQQVKRPLQIESLGGSLLLVGDRLGLIEVEVVTSYGSQNIAGATGSAVAALQLVLLAAALVAVWVAFGRGPRDDGSLLTAAAASVAAFVAFGKVLSPQYLVWLVPVVPLAAAPVWLPAVGGLLGAAVLTQLWFPDRYGDLVAEGAVAWIVLARNALLVLLFAALLAGVRRPVPFSLDVRHLRTRRAGP